jgi:hypothetical protein
VRSRLLKTTTGVSAASRQKAASAARGPAPLASTPAVSEPTGIAPHDTKRTVAITRDSSSGGLAIWRWVRVQMLNTTTPPAKPALAAFAEHAELPFPLLSDQDSRLAAALRLPAFRASGQLRLKRLTLLVDPEREVRAVQFPIADPAASVREALQLVQQR